MEVYLPVAPSTRTTIILSCCNKIRINQSLRLTCMKINSYPHLHLFMLNQNIIIGFATLKDKNVLTIKFT